MYWIRIEPLREAFRRGDKPTDRQLLPYLVAGVILISLGTIPIPDLRPEHQLALFLVTAVVGILGLLALYKANGGRNGDGLLAKVAMLGWVVAVRTVLIAIPIEFVSEFIIWEVSTGLNPNAYSAWIVFLIGCYHLIWFAQLGYHIRKTRRSAPRTDPALQLAPFDV